LHLIPPGVPVLFVDIELCVVGMAGHAVNSERTLDEIGRLRRDRARGDGQDLLQEALARIFGEARTLPHRT